MRVGVVVVLAGLAVDVAYHLTADEPSVAAPCCGVGFVGHAVTLAGMAIALMALVRAALLTRTPRNPIERRQ